MYEYKVVPAPLRAAKAKGLKTVAERFAHALAERINAEAAGGWQFVRTETLPCEERKRFGGARTSTQVVMIFARELGQPRPDASAALVAAAQFESEPEATPSYEAEYAAAYAEARPDADGPAAPYYESAHDDQPEVQPAPQPRREPVFRAGAMLRGDGPTARIEPVLRPRPPRQDED
ncbi:MAG: DUF4177 domain-containing protein [Rhodobacter sp.]|nr:DUF4177 domain-containing protein [Paracoccaceae bacterium]MCC0080804.1 DUF4177 domain-containing protein [Rhodobacter sp.]